VDWHPYLPHVAAAILAALGAILVTGIRGVFYLGELSEHQKRRDAQIDDHEGRIGSVEKTVVIHGTRLKRVDPEGE